VRVTQEAQVNASTAGAGAGGDILLEAPTVATLNGARVGSTAQAAGNGGNIAIRASDSFLATGTNGSTDPATNRGTRITAASFFTATGAAGSIDIAAGTVELADGARISSSTSGIGDGGSVRLSATGDVVLRGRRADGSGSAIKASTEVEDDEGGVVTGPRLGAAGTVTIDAPSLSLLDGAEIVGNTALLGPGGRVVVDVGELYVADARIASESTAVGADAGAAGAVDISADSILVENGGTISAATVDGASGTITLTADSIGLRTGGIVSAASTGAGQGGDVVLQARTIDLAQGGTVSASSTGTGNAGALRVSAAETLTMQGSSLRTSAPLAAGGDIEIAVGHNVSLTGSAITAEAGGVTPTDAGGNISIDPDFVVLNESQIIASANAGNGGNITIATGFFVASAGSVLDASSTRGVDGEVLIDAPNEITGSVLPLETPPAQAEGLFTQNCVPRLARERSTLTVTSRGAATSVRDYLATPPSVPTAIAVAARAPAC
jgi:large exoprotein involved in heme utilization and adhesion